MTQQPGGWRPPRTPQAAAVLVIAAVVLGACGGAAAPSPTPTAVARATLPPATAAPATPAPATAAPTTAPTAAPSPADVINIEAGESETSFYLKADRLTVSAGRVTFNVANKGKLTHELMVYPIQDVTQLLALHRADKKADEMALIKGMAAMEEDIDAGKTATVTATLAPGFYEIACHVRSKAADGSTFTHFDKGQVLTLAVIGAGGPAATIATAANTLNVEMNGDEKASWLFTPDRLVLSSGEVTFKVTNNMKVEHEFIVHRIGDVSAFAATLLKGGIPHGMMHEMLEPLNGKELIEDLAPGKTEQVTVKLTPGLWVAACYLVSKASDGTSFIHRDRGQRIVFEVR